MAAWRRQRIAGATFLVGSLGLVYGLSLAQKPQEAAERAPGFDPTQKVLVAETGTLGGENRYLTHLSTDKPVYRPGETAYFRGVMLHGSSRKPLEQQMQASYQVVGPKGDTITQGMTNAEDSVLGFSWTIPVEQAGGEYTVKVTHPWTGYPPAERKFDVRVYRAPRLKNQIVFVRDGYGPGDEVAASLHTERAEGGIPAGAPVTVIARVDEQEVYRGNATINAEGNCEVRFQLPEAIARGEGTLALVIDDGGAVETASKTIPILLQTVDLNMYAEGGELVAGLPGRVYLEAKTPAKKPADLQGLVVDSQGQQVAEFRTEHEGRGRFEFTPQAGEKYTLKITEPSGIKTTYPLPEVAEQGAVLSSPQLVYEPGQPVKVSVAATQSGKYRVTLSQKEAEKASLEQELAAGQATEMELTPPREAEGVLIATLWDPQGLPVAERLIFRRPANEVSVEIVPDKQQYVPGDKVRLTLKTKGADGKPVSAVVGVTATDESVLEMIDKREQAPRLPVMVLLEGEVRELADAHVYLDPQDEQAPLAVDLLLGTQGWRKFAFVQTEKFIAEHGDAARRVLVLAMPTQRERMAMFGGGRGGAVQLEAAAVEAFALPAEAGAPQPLAVPADAPLADADARPGAPDAQILPPAANQAKEAVEELRDAREERGADRPAMPAAPRPPAESKPRQQLQQALREADAKRQVEGLLRQRMIAGDEMGMAWSAVRVYAHEVRPNRQPGDRVDFTETVFWNAGIRTDQASGEAILEFGLSDSVTSFRVTADAFNNEGALGMATAAIEAVEPFYLEPKLPLEVTSGDVIQLPIGIVNASSEELKTRVTVTAENGQTGGYPQFTLAPGQRKRELFTIDVASFTGPTQFTFEGKAGSYADKVTRPLNVKPLGFPIEVAFGGMLNQGSIARHKLTIPEGLIPYSLETKVHVLPTPLASMTSALERLIQEPYGCFEQTSSSTYPLIMAQQYFQSHTGVDPSLISRSNEMLAKGYARLLSYECKQQGYEWFGEDPGHEALTAYGLLEFSDMSKVYPVDQKMLERTRTWLLSQRDGQGGFKRGRRALHTWLTDADVSNAYITWALLEAGEKNPTLTEEIAALNEAATKSDNLYVVALAANVQALAGEAQEAKALMDRLAKEQGSDGVVEGKQSIVGSGGDALKIETTALATLAWLRDKDYTLNTEKAIQWLAEQCQGGRYGSTQSTILALRAIVEYDKSRANPKADGSVLLTVDGEALGEPIAFTKETQGVIELPDIRHLLTPGEHTIELQMADGSEMPYLIAINYNSVKPNTSDECQVGFSVKLSDEQLAEGDITEARLTVSNKSDKAVPTPVAIIGLPGGLEPRHDQLKELVKSGQAAAYEVLGRDVVLYWREFGPSETKELSLSLVAGVPGSYTGPASRAYLYYTDEHKVWQDGLKVEITPAQQK